MHLLRSVSLAALCGTAASAAADVPASATSVAAPVAPRPLAAAPARSATEIVFPPPPDPPRLRYLGSLAKFQDMPQPAPGPWTGLWNLLTGRRPPQGAVIVRPYGVAADATRVYVADTDGTAIVVFDWAAHRVIRFGGTRDGRLLTPIGVAVTEGGTVYVTDSTQDVVKAFAPDGRLVGAYHITPTLKRPTGIAYDAPRRRLLIADTGNSRVLISDLEGKLLREFGGKGTDPGRMSMPVNVAADKDGRIFVVDPIMCRVQVFSADGVFERAFGERGDMAGQFARPRGIAVDSDGHLHIADALFNAVQVFDPDGRILMYYGGGGSVPGTFDLPGGVFIDGRDQVYVTDTMNGRVEIFQYLKAPVAPF